MKDEIFYSFRGGKKDQKSCIFHYSVWPFNAQVSNLLQEFLDFFWTRIPIGDIKAKRKGGSHIKVLWIEQKHIPSTEIRVKTGKGKGIFLGVFQGEHFNSCYRVWSLILISVWQRSWKVLKKKKSSRSWYKSRSLENSINPHICHLLAFDPKMCGLFLLTQCAMDLNL